MDNEKMFPTKVTRLSRYEFQDGGFLRSDSDGLEVFGTLNVLVPEDDPAPTVRDLTDEERDADAMLRDEARERGKKVLAPATKFVLFKRGMVLEPLAQTLIAGGVLAFQVTSTPPGSSCLTGKPQDVVFPLVEHGS